MGEETASLVRASSVTRTSSVLRYILPSRASKHLATSADELVSSAFSTCLFPHSPCSAWHLAPLAPSAKAGVYGGYALLAHGRISHVHRLGAGFDTLRGIPAVVEEGESGSRAHTPRKLSQRALEGLSCVVAIPLHVKTDDVPPSWNIQTLAMMPCSVHAI